MIELSEGIGASPSTSGSLVSCRPSDRIFDTKVEDITEEALALPSEAKALLADRLVSRVLIQQRTDSKTCICADFSRLK